MKNLVNAVLAVMSEVQGIDKDMDVSAGTASYKGVSDKSVKLKIGEAMRKHGLVILPIGIEPKTEIKIWIENDYHGKPKQKQWVFTEVKTKYLLCHSSGESQEIFGYGHGVDSQDKGAGKATTYALKYTLLYTFLVATGHIDDADRIHSDEIQTPNMSYLDEWRDALNNIKDLASIAEFYKQNKQIVDSDANIKQLFSERKTQLK